MKILIASDSFKGSASSIEIANALEEGLKKNDIVLDIIKMCIADGGEGTVTSIVEARNGRYEYVNVTGPLGTPCIAKYGVFDTDTVILEMAEASGLTLINEKECNPLISTTFGTGEMIKEVLSKGYKKIYIGLGGSATNDGGVGMAQALGVSFKDCNNNEIGFGGSNLANIEKIDISGIDKRINGVEVIVISDVKNVLCGENGASYIYGPQKGATGDDVKFLDDSLYHYGNLINSLRGKDIMSIPGSGAAGGLGAGLIAFCNAKIESGIITVLNLLNFENKLESVDLVITGEGKIDGQSTLGKVPSGIAELCKKHNVPLIAIAGCLGDGHEELYSCGVNLMFSIANKPMTIDESKQNVIELTTNLGETIGRIINMKIQFQLKDTFKDQ